MKAFIRLSIVSVVFINLLSCVYQKPISKITATNNKTYLVEYIYSSMRVAKYIDFLITGTMFIIQIVMAT